MNKNESVKPTDNDLTQKQNNSINNILDSNTIKRFLGIKYCQNKMIIPVIVDRTDFEYLDKNFVVDPELVDERKKIQLIFDDMISDYMESMDKEHERNHIEINLNKRTINKLNGIMFNYEKKYRKYTSPDDYINNPLSISEYLSYLIEKEFQSDRESNVESLKQIRKINRKVIQHE